jgi:hypothetical protein
VLRSTPLASDAAGRLEAAPSTASGFAMDAERVSSDSSRVGDALALRFVAAAASWEVSDERRAPLECEEGLVCVLAWSSFLVH